MDSATAYPMISGQVRLSIGRHVLDIHAQVPDVPVHLDEVLSLFRVVTDALVEVGVSDVEDEGQKVSCTKGCGACCCQLVPITPPEAVSLAASMADWPEERRARVTSRFDDILSRLVSSGWLEKWNALQVRHANRPHEDFVRLGLEYFHLGLPCPFLEEQACSVYLERPLICRQFLVTSDPLHCGAPRPENTRTVPLPARPNALLGALAKEAGYPEAFVPLTLMPSMMASAPPRGRKETGKAWAERLFKALSGHELPAETPLPLMSG